MFIENKLNATLSSTVSMQATLLSQHKDILQLISRNEAEQFYAREMNVAPILDGKNDDWLQGWPPVELNESHIRDISLPYSESSLSADLQFGVFGDELYGMARVTDDKVVYREINGLSVHRNDHVQLLVADDDGRVVRHTFAPFQPGAVTAFLISGADQGGRAIRLADDISGYWLATEAGYNIEFKLPQSAAASFVLGLGDVDTVEDREIGVFMATGQPEEISKDDNRIVSIASLTRALSSFSNSDTSLFLLDKQGRVLTHVKANQTDKVARQDSIQAGDGDDIIRMFSSDHFVHRAAVEYEGDIIAYVIGTHSREALDQQLRYLMGLMMALSVILILLLVTGLFVFNQMVVNRSRLLLSQMSTAVDKEGRLQSIELTADAGSPLAELVAGVDDVTSRLQQYTDYLEQLSGRLAHELRTPVTVVRSSLDNLSLALGDKESQQQIYLKRAYEGVASLSGLLASMTEATRLEQSLDRGDMQDFDLAEVVAGCIEGYQGAYPDVLFEFLNEASSIVVCGVPELINQMLDKLVANAVQFADIGTPVRFRLSEEDDKAFFRVMNEGPKLPEALDDRLFDSMISLRTGDVYRQGSHLGLGLYIVRLITQFHGGSVSISNREDTVGVMVTVQIPVRGITANY